MEMFFNERKPYDIAAVDREYGLHSNIPACCVEFWVTKFTRIFHNETLLADLNARHAATEKRIKKQYNYRPCFDCLDSGYWQKLHVCRGACAGLAERLRDKYAYPVGSIQWHDTVSAWRRDYVQEQS